MNTELIVFESLTPEKVFSEGGSLPIIQEIEKKVAEFKGSVETLKGRKEIASFASKVSKSKTFLDNMGKELKAQYRAKIDPIDNERKAIRDRLDELKEQARKPLTDWEEEQKRIEEEAEALEKFNADHEDAIKENAIFNREREIARREEEIKRQEVERLAKEAAEQAERDRLAREEQLKKEAAEQARRDAEEKARLEKEGAIRKQVEAEQAAKKAQEEKEAAELRAKQADERRLSEIKAAQEKAEREKREALEAQERAQAEKERLAQVEADRLKAIEDARKADTEHRAKINRAILGKFVALGTTEDFAKTLICAIAKGEVDNVSINY
jgi:chromosome segregation ATPase